MSEMNKTFTDIEQSIHSHDVESALNSVIDGMKAMLQMIKLSLQNSSPSSLIDTLEPLLLPAIQKIVNEGQSNKDKRIEALQKIIVQNQKKLDDSEDFVLHLQRRISHLEEINNQHLCDCGCGNEKILHKYENISENLEQLFEEITVTQSQVTILREKLDRDHDLLRPDVSLDSSGSVVSSVDPSPAGSRENLLHDTIDPSPSAAHVSVDEFPVPEQNNNDLQDKLNKIMKTQQADEDNKVRRQVLFSNIDLPVMNNRHYVNDRMNFWPYLRSQLDVLNLQFILRDAESVSKLKSGALKVTYEKNWQARSVINRLRGMIGHIKSSPRNEYGHYENSYGHVLSDDSTAAFLNIKFTRLIPKRYNSKRKILQKFGNHLKDTRKIIWFDLHVIKEEVYLKTKWRQQHTDIGGQHYYTHRFTHYTVDQAEAIMAGLMDVDEDREARDRSQRRVRQ